MSFSRFFSPIAIALLGSFPAAALATPEKAASYYEDALRRYEKDDIPAAVIQLKNAIQQDQKMLAAHLLLGKALLKNGDLKGAEAAFEEALKQGVNRGEVAIPLGQVYLALGRPEAVIERIQATGLSPALQVEVLTMRGNAYMEAGNNSQARQSWEQARAIDPRSALPLIAEVPMLLATNRLDQAREKAEKAIELAPNNASAWNMKASVHHAALDAKNALAAYDKALSFAPKHVDARVARAALLIDLGREPDARKDLDYLKTIAEDEPRAAYLRAVLAGKKGNAVETNDALKEVTRTIDAVPPAWLVRREQLLMAGALAHYGLGNLQKSREYLDTLISRSPNNLGAKKLLASIYVDSGDYGRAQPLLDALLRSMPDDPQVLYMLGTINLAQKRYVVASSQLERAVSLTGSAEMTKSLGFSLLGAGQSEKGLANLEKAFSANPSDIQAGMALSTIFMRLNKPERGMKIAEAMVKSAPGNLIALNFLGSLKAAKGDSAGARGIFQQVLAKDPLFSPSSLNLARLDVSEQRYDDARRRLDLLVKQNANDYLALFEYGQLEQKAGRFAEAIRFLNKAGDVQRSDPAPTLALVELYLGMRQPEKALEIAKGVAAKFSENLQVQLTLARTYLANGVSGSAQTILAAATRLAEYDPVAQVAIARLQLSAANPEGASYSVYKALQGKPDDIAALALAVQIEALRGNAGKADAALKVLMEKYPNSIETTRVSANLAMQRSQFQLAITGYKKVLAQEPHIRNVLALVQAHVAAGEVGKAASILDGWVKTHPTDKAAYKALAEIQFRAGNLSAAKQSYQVVTKNSPDDAAALNNYANLLHQLNDPGAQEMAERAVKLNPQNAAYADTLGWIHFKNGQFEPALRYLREARLRSPESAEIRFHLAAVLAKVGRKDEAIEELKAVDSMKQGELKLHGMDELRKELAIKRVP